MLSKLVVYWNIGRPRSDAPYPVRIAAPPHDARRPELRGGQTAGFDRDDRLRLVHVAGISRGEQAAWELVEEWQRYRYFARERPPDPRRGGNRIDARGLCGRDGERPGFRLEQYLRRSIANVFQLRAAFRIGKRFAFGTAQQERVSAGRDENGAQSREIRSMPCAYDTQAPACKRVDQL